MIKKIKVSDLLPGMYIHDLNCSWLDHPFMQNSFLLKSSKEIEKIAGSNIHELYIDTGRGLDVPEDSAVPAVQPPPEDLPKKSFRRIRTAAPFPEELVRARKIYHEANHVVQDMFLDTRLGKQVQLTKIRPTVEAMIGSVLRNPDAMISLSRIKQADRYTFQHSVAVATLLIAFGREMKLERTVLEQAGLGGLLHDVGKMKVPADILNKPGKLSGDEFAIMRRHVEYGCQILDGVPAIPSISLEVVAQHHERYDGSGYPKQLKGAEISVYGQMASIVDVYDAITSDRSYHRGNEPTAGLRRLFEWSVKQFNPELVQHFIHTVGIYPVGSLVRLDSGRLAVVTDQNREELLRPKVLVIFSTRTSSLIPPKSVDLSKPGVTERIISAEEPSRWKIDPMRYL